MKYMYCDKHQNKNTYDIMWKVRDSVLLFYFEYMQETLQYYSSTDSNAASVHDAWWYWSGVERARLLWHSLDQKAVAFLYIYSGIFTATGL